MSEWISVKDRLPEDYEKVLVTLRGDPMSNVDYTVGGRFMDHGDLVTHWQPLPERPKEEE